MSTSSKKADAVTVGVRIRPRNEKEIGDNMPVCFSASMDASSVEELDENGAISKNWDYDHVFGHDCTNQYIFQTVGVKLIDAALEGYNTVLFMYGQTSSGKTFTLFGGGSVTGLVGHAMEYVYERVSSSNDTEYVIKLTYAELYNEELKDLLSPTPNENLKIIDDPHLGPAIQNITEATFSTTAQVGKLLEEGENRRHFGVTNMNAHSSRSHVLVRLGIEMRKVPYKPAQPLRASWGRDKPTCLSTLNLVDLAGSERAGKAGTSGQSFKEGSFINKSLLTLGTVIANLSEGKSGQHVPYRNSKLTRLLASALGGNAKTCMITCISPASGNVTESLSTLRFASRAKRIVNVVHKNELQDAKSLAARLAQQNGEIDFLKSQLEISKQLGFNPNGSDDQATSLKDMAVAARKNLRGIRFLIVNVPKLAVQFKHKGMAHLAKKVQDDLLSAIIGSRDVEDILLEVAGLLKTYLPRETAIMEQLREVDVKNESDSIGNFDGEEDQLDTEAASGILSGLDFGHDETQETLENVQFYHEEYRGKTMIRFQHLTDELAKRSANEAKLQAFHTATVQSLHETAETLKRCQFSEASLQLRCDEIHSQRESEKLFSSQSMTQANERIAALEAQLAEKQSQVALQIQTINAKDSEIEKLRTQVDILNNDLVVAASSRKAFEEESFRVRHEMRSQMDKLRSNMHTFLQKGGEDNKVMEMQNEALVREVDSLRDHLEIMSESKERYEEEIGQLRTEISCLRESDKVRVEEIGHARDQLAKSTQMMHFLKLQVSQAVANNAVLDEDNQALRATISREVKERDAIVTELQDQLAVLGSSSRNSIVTLQTEVATKEKEIAAVHELLQNKLQWYSKQESNSNSEMTRLEKKLSHQIKLNEDLAHEHSNSTVHSTEIITKLQEENRELKSKNLDLQLTLDSMETYISSQLETTNAEAQSEYAYLDDECFVDDLVSPVTPRPISPGSRQSQRGFFRSPSLRDVFSNSGTPTKEKANAENSTVVSGGIATLSSAKNISVNVSDYNYNSSNNSQYSTNNSSPNVKFADEIQPFDNRRGVSPVPQGRNGLKRPASSGNIDIRVENAVAFTAEQNEEEKARFEQIVQAIKMVTIGLEHVLREGTPLWDVAIDVLERISREKNQQENILVRIQEKEESLLLARSTLTEEVETLTHQLTTLSKSHVSLEEKYSKLLDESVDLRHNEKAAQELARQYEAQQEFFRLQVHSTKSDLESTRLENECLVETNTELMTRMQSIFEAKVLAEAQIGEIDQELQIALAERDELIKRYISKTTSPHDFIAQSSRYSHTHTYNSYR